MLCKYYVVYAYTERLTDHHKYILIFGIFKYYIFSNSLDFCIPFKWRSVIIQPSVLTIFYCKLFDG